MVRFVDERDRRERDAGWPPLGTFCEQLDVVTVVCANRLYRILQIEMARAGIDRMVLGGVPINLSRGYDNVDALIADTAKAIGVPVTTSITAQMNALRAVGARNVAVGQPFGEGMNPDFEAHLTQFGFNPMGCGALGYAAIDLGRIPLEDAMRVGRALKDRHPEADTLWLPCPHWAVADAIEPLERELGVGVVGALQAIVWESLRRSGIDDPIDGFGRLLRDPVSPLDG